MEIWIAPLIAQGPEVPERLRLTDLGGCKGRRAKAVSGRCILLLGHLAWQHPVPELLGLAYRVAPG